MVVIVNKIYTMNKEIKIFLVLLGIVTLFYFIPMESVLFYTAVLSGLALLNEYVREHVLTCLIPASFLAISTASSM